jgi:LPXTG-motif cell wall-anchored protein
VRLRYGPGLTVSWTGSVTIPAPPAGRIVHTGPGAYSVIPPNTIPAWAIALIVIGALALLAMAALLLRTRRRSRFP